tara:strand:- start:340 stop:555 length:216 start_codon:yes stop_codon:yes gene_type:complete
MSRGIWSRKRGAAPKPVEHVEEIVEEIVEDNDHLLDEENLDEEVDLNHEASDDSDSGDDDNPWVSYIESQS